ncbi:MAG: hypothetical protein P1U87_18555 [Verrucomicrobiales bacterium]|nr:hypothetical protein [Verrucomicrobiales bacterium]
MAKTNHSTKDDEFHWLEVDLSDLAYLIRKHLKILIWVPLFGIALAVGIAKIQRPVFATEVEVYLRPNFDQEFQVERTYSKLDDSDSLRSIERALVSDTIVLAMVKKLGLRTDVGFLGETFKPGELTDARLLKAVRDRYTTKLVPTTRIVKLRVEDFSPARTALIAETLISEFLALLRDDRNLKEADLRSTLVAQSQKALEGALESEKELNRFRVANPDTLADQDSSIFQDRILQSGTALNEANSARSNLAGMIQALEGIDPRQDPFQVFQILSNRNSEYLSELLGMHARAKSEFGVAKEQYRLGHPAYITAESRLVEVEGTLRDYAAEMKSSVQSEYDAASQKVDKLSETLSILRSEMVGQKSVSAEFRGLKEEIDRNWNTYTSLQQKIRDLDLNPEVTPTFATVMSGPVVPDKKAKPGTLIYAAGGMILGGLCGLGLIFWKNRHGLPFTSQSQAEKQLSLATVASIPSPADGSRESRLTLLERSREMVGLLISLGGSKLIHVASIDKESPGEILSTAMSRACARQDLSVLLISIHYRIQRPADIVSDQSIAGLSLLDLPLEILTPPNGFQSGVTKLFESFDRIIVDTSRISEKAACLEVGRSAEKNLLLIQPGRGSFRSGYCDLVEELESAGVRNMALVSIEEFKPEKERRKQTKASLPKSQSTKRVFRNRPLSNPV